MKNLLFLQIALLLIGLTGCESSSTFNSSNANRTNTSAASNAANVDSMTNTAATSGNTAMANVGTTPKTSSQTANNAGTMATPVVTPSATPARKAEKQDEGLFSFPPPRVISFSIIDNKSLLNKEGQTTFAQISEKLEAGLKNAGYNKDEKYTYFWNEKDEFAIVTAMESVNADGTPFDYNSRWIRSPNLPTANELSEYFNYLIRGKKVFYRVFAFVVTSKRSGNSFKRNSPPDFQMALEWMNKGESELGGTESGEIGDVPFTDKYRCYALLYLFVNHTSLDNPKSLDALNRHEQGLSENINMEAGDHLRQTNINFGG